MEIIAPVAVYFTFNAAVICALQTLYCSFMFGQQKGPGCLSVRLISWVVVTISVIDFDSTLKYSK